jgi:hypothetical protein
VVVQFVHVEGEVGQHLVVELVEEGVFHWILAVDLPQDVPENHEHSVVVEHVAELAVGLLAREEVQGLSNSD